MTTSRSQGISTGPAPAETANRQPDATVVRHLYVDQRLVVNEIAKLLSLKRSQVRAALTSSGVEWRTTRKKCPVDESLLRKMVSDGKGAPATLARTYGVAHNTAARWLADAGLLPADPAISEDDLRELYVTQQLNTREVAAKLGVNRSKILRALASAGIPARPRESKRPRTAVMGAAGARVPDGQHVEARTTPSATVEPRGRDSSHRGRRQEANHPQPDLISMYTDPEIVTVLKQVDTAAPTPTRPITVLYWEIGLSIHQVALLCDVSDATIHRRLRQAGVPLRPATQPSPWNQRRLSGGAPPGTNRGTSTTHPNKNSTLDRTPREEQ